MDCQDSHAATQHHKMFHSKPHGCFLCVDDLASRPDALFQSMAA
jgi:hypothetical protein